MPCRVEYDGSDALEVQRLSRILCAACKRLDAGQPWEQVLRESPGLQSWWLEHQEADRKREEQEARLAAAEKVRREALAKLTDEERRVLFPFGTA